MSVPRHEFGVYVICNTVNGKVYIGSTIRSFASRWNEHQSRLTARKHVNKHLQSAWVKYGPSVFTFTAIEVVKDKALIIAREQYWIDWYLENHKPGCYNKRAIANSNQGVRMSERNRQKRSAMMKGNTYSKNAARTIADKISKTYPGLIGPDGTEYRDIKNLRAFALEHGIHEKMIYEIANRQRTSSGGWTHINPRPWIKVGSLPRLTYAFVSPQGVIYQGIEHLDAFCKEQGLVRTHMWAVSKGKKPQYKGWRKL